MWLSASVLLKYFFFWRNMGYYNDVARLRQTRRFWCAIVLIVRFHGFLRKKKWIMTLDTVPCTVYCVRANQSTCWILLLTHVLSWATMTFANAVVATRRVRATMSKYKFWWRLHRLAQKRKIWIKSNRRFTNLKERA